MVLEYSPPALKAWYLRPFSMGYSRMLEVMEAVKVELECLIRLIHRRLKVNTTHMSSGVKESLSSSYNRGHKSVTLSCFSTSID